MCRFTLVAALILTILKLTAANATSLFDLPGVNVSFTPIHTGATFAQVGVLSDALDGDEETYLHVGSHNQGVAGGGTAGIQIDVISVVPFQLESAVAQFDAWVEQDFRGSPSVSRVVYAAFEGHLLGGDWLMLMEQRNEHHQANPGQTRLAGTLLWVNETNLSPFDMFRTRVIAEGGVFDTNFDPTTIRSATVFDFAASVVPEPSAVSMLAMAGVVGGVLGTARKARCRHRANTRKVTVCR